MKFIETLVAKLRAKKIAKALEQSVRVVRRNQAETEEEGAVESPEEDEILDEDIIWWFQEAKKEGATHLIIYRDGQLGSYHALYVHPNEDVRAEVARFDPRQDDDEKNPDKVEEVYDLRLDMQQQLDEARAFHLE